MSLWQRYFNEKEEEYYDSLTESDEDRQERRKAKKMERRERRSASKKITLYRRNVRRSKYGEE